MTTDWHLPPNDLLRSDAPQVLPDPRDDREQGERIAAKLGQLSYPCSLERIVSGPQLSLYLLRPDAGVEVRTMPRRAPEIALEVAAQSVRVLAPVPGESLVGVEVSAASRRVVRLAEMPPAERPLTVPIGLDVDGETCWLDLADAPQTLVAGQTGSGKSIFLTSILCSLLRSFTPADLGLLLIDPKRVELAPFARVPHLLCPVADDVDSALRYLRAMVEVMEGRYEVMAQLGARDMETLNAALERRGRDRYPRLLVICDELADLMMTAEGEAESLIVRLAQKGRAAGIHLLLATQSPRVAVVTGLIKVNIPTRVAFSVPSMTDSRVILDRNGAQDLLGKGDGLLSFGGGIPRRFQGALVTTDEVDALCEHWTGQTREMATA